ncbi:MAG: M24 family metallopeptidase [Acidobacteriota bacterium]
MSGNLAPIEIVSEKLEQAVNLLGENSVDMWVTFVQETSAGRERVFDYISVGHLTWESAIIITKQKDKVVILGKFDEQPFRDSKLYTEILPYVQDFKEPFSEVLKRFKPQTIALNFSFNDPSADGISYGKYVFLERTIKEILPSSKIVSAEGIISGIISQKSAKEVEYIKEAVKITERIFEEITSFLKVGLSEKEVYDFIQKKIAEKGTTPSFETLVFSGDRGDGMGHGQATENKIMEGDLLHVDMGVFYNGYASDLQRTWYFLRKGETAPPEEAIKGFNTIRDAIIESGNALKPGAKGFDIDTISRNKVVSSGYPEYPHALGHQLGRFVHDGGALLGPNWARYKNTPFMELKEGQVFTLEPSLSVKGFGAIGIEEDVIVTKEGAKYISNLQKELWLVGQ